MISPHHHSNILQFSPPHHSIILTWIAGKLFQHFISSLFYLIQCLFFCTVMSPQTIDSLFQGKLLSRESFPGNHFSMELLHKTSFQRVNCPDQNRFQDKPFFSGIVFQRELLSEKLFHRNHVFKGIVSARTFFRGIVSARTFFKGTLFWGIVSTKPLSRELFQITSFSVQLVYYEVI